MNVAAIALGLLVAAAMTIFVTSPWWAHRGNGQLRFRSVPRPAWDSHDHVLRERYESVLTALRDLDFDHTVGKVTKEDYSPLRHALMEEAADVVVQLDERSVVESEVDPSSEVEILVIGQTLPVESALRVRAVLPLSDNACPACGRILRPGSVFCTSCGIKLNPMCPECGRLVDATDLFCGGCGTVLTLAVS